MEKPEIIEQKIKELQIQLQESEKFYQYELVCTTEWSEKMIGFFNIGNAEKILKLLYGGSKLQYRHGQYGDVDVWMNPQKNRVLVSPKNEALNEKNIMDSIVWGVGDWYLRK